MGNVDTSLMKALAESFCGPYEKSMRRFVNTDFHICQHAGLVGFVPASEAAELWVRKNVVANCPLWVERHHAGDLLSVLYREGFHVSVGMTGGTRSARLRRNRPQLARGQPHQ